MKLSRIRPVGQFRKSSKNMPAVLEDFKQKGDFKNFPLIIGTISAYFIKNADFSLVKV